MYYSIGEVAELLSVTVQTLRNWEKQGKITSVRSGGGYRKFEDTEINRLLGRTQTQPRKTLVYARVSTPSRKDDLNRQKEVLEMFCIASGWEYITLTDIGGRIHAVHNLIRRYIRRYKGAIPMAKKASFMIDSAMYTYTRIGNDLYLFITGLGRLLSTETERLNDKNQRRNRIWAQIDACEQAGDHNKADRIRCNNFGTVKKQRQNNRFREQARSCINQSIYTLIKAERPDVVVTEELTFQSWQKKLPKAVKRKLTRWMKGYIQERLTYICELRGVHVALVNPAYTSQICHRCGRFGKRNGKHFTGGADKNLDLV